MNLRTTAIIGLILAICYLATLGIRLAGPRLGRLLGRYSDNLESHERVLQVLRLETFLGIWFAVGRALIICVALYLIWRQVMPTTAPIALVGASAFFAIVAGSTLGPLLRDITSGTLMIAERWYHVGDHIKVEPFDGAAGVVEVLTPRSTKLRSLNGDAIWVHNQHIQGVRVTARGIRTISLDVFVTNLEQGKKLIEKTTLALPEGPMMLARQLAISQTEKLGDDLWRIIAVGQTMPGREWLIEDFAVKAILKYDALSPSGPVILHGPIATYTDAAAERRFRRTVRAKKG